MELEHHFTVPASVEQTWAAFNDPEKVAPCFPGATLISVDGDEFTGSARIKLGPIALQYNGTGTYVERDESAYRAVIKAKGKDKRGNGLATATITAQLRPDGEGTAVHVTTDLTVTGKPAQFGRGVMQGVSDNLLGQFVACLQAKLGAPEAAQVPAADAHPAHVQAADAHPAQVGATAVTSAEGVHPAQVPAADAQPVQVGATAVTSAQGVTPATEVTAATTPQGSATGGAAAPRTQAPAYRPASPPAPAAAAELNLLSTVGSVLRKRYAAPVLGILALIVGYLLGRRARC